MAKKKAKTAGNQFESCASLLQREQVMSSCKSVLGCVHMMRSTHSDFCFLMEVKVQHFLAGESLLNAVD